MSTLWTNIPGLMDLFIFSPVFLVTIGGVGSAIIVFFMVCYPHRKERDSRLYDATFYRIILVVRSIAMVAPGLLTFFEATGLVG